jgi:hypothetical protein
MNMYAEIAAMKRIVRVLDGLDSPWARRRVLDYVSQWAWNKDNPPEEPILGPAVVEDISHAG